MTKRPNKINLEIIELNDMVLDSETVKKLRASSSMFNKSTYVQVSYGGVRYNVESVDRQKTGKYRISLISPVSLATAVGMPDSHVDLIKLKAI